MLCDKDGAIRAPPAAAATTAAAAAAAGKQLRRPLSARSLAISIPDNANASSGGGTDEGAGAGMIDVRDDDIAPILRMASCKFADVQCDGARAMYSIANGPPPVRAVSSSLVG